MRTAILTLAFSAILIVEARDISAQTALPASLEFRVSVSPLLGLDRLFRGVSLETGIGIRDSAFLPAATARLTWDSGLSAWMAETLLSLGLGPGLEIHGGLILPLTRLRAETGGGQSLDLGIMDPPIFFGLDASLASLDLGQGTARLEVRFSVDYRNWQLTVAREAGRARPFRNGDTLAAFSLGFTAGIVLRLGITPFAQGKKEP